MSKKKIGFLFGAGAEISYGMPTGGKFALEIFRRDVSSAKNTFKENRSRIDISSQYASNWLPDGYPEKKVGAFGDSVFENIIKDTVSNNREYIISRINKFDDVVNRFLSDDLNRQIEQELGKRLPDVNIRHQLKYNKIFDERGNDLFQSKYFSVLISYYRDFNFENPHDKELLGDIIKSIFQLHIGALSETLSRNIQENIFDNDGIELDIFDDLSGSLSLNYQSAGVKGLELLSKTRQDHSHDIVNFAFNALEAIYADVLDYKSVIDSNWHYLYLPKSEWGKFCKISVFLHSVREYISNECRPIDGSEGYYDDLLAQELFDIHAIGTSNYVNTLIGGKLDSYNIAFLNGSIDEYYDPYVNRIITAGEFGEYDHFAVPLIFTQSGTKPMTSIDMSIKYVRYYEKMKESDIICSIGFGFNSDDEHINGVIRTLVERDNKILLIVALKNEQDVRQRINELSKKLKISKIENIKLLEVDSSRESQGKIWTECILDYSQ